MNEFFVKLLNKYSKDGFVNLNAFEFKLAIDEACKAQRNACARVYEADYISKGGYNIYDYINTAEITEVDYE